jgi:hypothetical protein
VPDTPSHPPGGRIQRYVRVHTVVISTAMAMTGFASALGIRIMPAFALSQL